MKFKKFILPIIIIFLGVISMITCHLLFNIVKTPLISEKEFEYSVTYELNGKSETIEGTYICSLDNESGDNTDPTDRYYIGIHKDTNMPGNIRQVIEKKGDREIVLFVELSPDYLMGDPFYDDKEYYGEDDPYEPKLLVFDNEGCEYSDEESLSEFDVKIVDWELPEPITNELKFSHFGRLSVNSIFPMLICGYVALLVCILFIRKEQEVTFNLINKISVVCNFLISLAVAPFFALFASLTQIYTNGADVIYQLDYCIPAITVLFVAISLCFRRKGLTKSGLIIQFVGPALFVLSLIIEAIFTIFKA